MRAFVIKLSIIVLIVIFPNSINSQEFQGKAYYFSKTTMDMSRFGRGGQMNEQQKKQMEARMKSWLEKTYVLTFNKEESIFKEDEKLAAPTTGGGGRGFGFMSSFSSGPQYKNIKSKTFIQDQEFFGKQFLIKEEMKSFEWKMGAETKQIGKYTCFRATASRPSTEINWSSPRRSNDTNTERKSDSTKTDATSAKVETEDDTIEMIEVVAWYTPMIPVSQGPGEYWGLPGLILEVSAGNNIMLCSKIVMNPEEKTKIQAPDKGKVVSKKEYNEIIVGKIQEMRANRGRQGSGGGRSRL